MLQFLSFDAAALLSEIEFSSGGGGGGNEAFFSFIMTKQYIY